MQTFSLIPLFLPTTSAICIKDTVNVFVHSAHQWFCVCVLSRLIRLATVESSDVFRAYATYSEQEVDVLFFDLEKTPGKKVKRYRGRACHMEANESRWSK